MMTLWRSPGMRHCKRASTTSQRGGSVMNIKRRDFIGSCAAIAGGLLAPFAAAPAHAQDAAWEKAVRGKYGGTEIRILGISHPATDAMRAMAPEFERATGIKLVWEV